MNVTESGTTTYKLQHCTEPGEYHYEVRIASEVRKGKRSFFSGMKMRYVLQCQGYFNTGTLRYRLFCKEKVPVDPKGFPLKKLSKAMQLALRITAINDDLVFHVSPAMKILQLENPEEVREKWKGLRPGLESRYPDLGKSITDFEWQLKDENIQRCYTEDTLFRFLFPAIFETSYSERFRKEKLLCTTTRSKRYPFLWLTRPGCRIFIVFSTPVNWSSKVYCKPTIKIFRESD